MWIVAILMLFWQATPAHAGPVEDCEQASDIDRSIHGCTELIRLFPGSATVFFNRGSAYLSKGDLDRAIDDNTRVIQIDPTYAAAYYHRGIAYESMKQYGQAIADFSKTVAFNPGHGGAFHARARVYLRIGQRMLALLDAEHAVSLDPLSEAFRDTRAHAYEALGRTQEAVADYRRLLSSNRSMKSAIDGLRRLGASAAKPTAPADAARTVRRSPRPQHDAAQPRYTQEEVECERAQQADPAGHYAGYPCWAREALSPSNRGRGR